MRSRLSSVMFLLVGSTLGIAIARPVWDGGRENNAFAHTSDASADIAAVRSEVERLKGLVPDQAHAMQDVDYHFANLWFAAQNGHWQLAQFYLNETKSHLRWAVRIIPVRKDNAGREVKLEAILEALENTPLKQLDESVKGQDREKFAAAYEFTLTGCYSCHKAADKPFLRPRIPAQPASAIISFDPNASWPR